jgi:hypothetical protein
LNGNVLLAMAISKIYNIGFENYKVEIFSVKISATAHTGKVGKNLLLLASPISPLFWRILYARDVKCLQQSENETKMFLI